MIVSFDLTGVLCLIIIPPIIVFLSKLGWELANLTRSRYLLHMNEYYKERNIELVKEINDLIVKFNEIEKERN